MKKILLLSLLNAFAYLAITITISVLYYKYLIGYNIKFVLFVILIIFTNIFLYNHIYFWIISKSKKNSQLRKFFSTWGRHEIRQNIHEFFDEKYTQTYKKIINFVYILLIVNLILIAAIPIYIVYFYWWLPKLNKA